MRGAVDFLCPRGWCYVEDCEFYETKPSAAMWHDGSRNEREKFVPRNRTFDGVDGWSLARHHHDAAFYFLTCRFSESMIDLPPLRVVYPLGSAPATDADRAKNRELDRTNRWGERAYFFDCHREGGDYAWHADNLETASPAGAPPLTPDDVTPAWTFDGTWDPESTAGPKIESIERRDGEIVVAFDEPVTVKGAPRLELADGGAAAYAVGSGSAMLVFNAAEAAPTDVTGVDLNGGYIIASQASATLRAAELELPGE
jgi:pectinesterase